MRSRDDLLEGNCWLCGKHGPLTLEHIPPHAAFNEHPLLLQRVSERSKETGVLTWERGRLHQRGLASRSLCARCNNRAGQRFAPPYIQLIKTVAERVGSIQVRHFMTVQKIKKPQLILRQIIQQFVTANGPTFVDANDWVRPFLQPESRTLLPPDVCVYLFATNRAAARTTGISGHVYAGKNQVRIVSEFTFWPLGTVLSYGELPDQDLTPIHHWCRLPYKSNETADVTLCVNATDSTLPIDFRSEAEMIKARTAQAEVPVSESSLLELKDLVLKRAGKSGEDEFIYTAHPSQANLLNPK